LFCLSLPKICFFAPRSDVAAECPKFKSGALVTDRRAGHHAVRVLANGRPASASPTDAVSRLMLREPEAQFSTASSPELPSRTIAPPESV
jgi:hypothetical protein